MVQVGNLHIGKANTATPPKVDIGEAFILSKHLYYRYNCLEQTLQYNNWANDTDFKMVIEVGLNYLEKEISIIEEQMYKYKIPQPSRSPKSVKISADIINTTIINDQFLFEQIRNGCIASIEKNLHNAMMILNNDSLRLMFINFVKEEMEIVFGYFKYGKLKGWVPIYPIYQSD